MYWTRKNLKTHPRIQPGHQQIHRHRDQHHQGGDDDDDALHQGIVALGDGFLEPVGDAGPGIGDLDEKGAADQGGDGDAGDREHRQQGVGQAVAQHHTSFVQAAAAGGLDIIGIEGAAQVEAQGVGEDAAQQ